MINSNFLRGRHKAHILRGRSWIRIRNQHVLEDYLRPFTIPPSNAISRHLGASTGRLLNRFHDPAASRTPLGIALDHRIGVFEAETYALATHLNRTWPRGQLSTVMGPLGRF